MRRRLPFFLLSSLLGAGSPLAAQTRVFPISNLLPVAEVNLTLGSQGSPHTVELRNFGPTADPVLNLISSLNTQTAQAIASGGQLILSVPGTTVGRFTLVVRSRSSGSVETGDVLVDGQLLQSGVQFSTGSVISMNSIADGEIAAGIDPPNGAKGYLAYLVSTDGNDILGRTGGGPTSLRLPSGQDVLAVYASRSPLTSGPLRVYRNDAAHDSDGDGLGDGLEAALGTCASGGGSVAGVECADIADPRDTDGDGLWDGWEVLGFNAQWQDPSGAHVRQNIRLPSWGADPRHKDIFLEVDFRRLTQADSNVAEHMSPMVARQMAAIYADSATTDGVLQLVHALSVTNPDRRPGVSLHLDTGVPPVTPADATIYGDWGGYTPVNAVQDSLGNFGPENPGTASQQQMSPGRRGIFHYVLGYTTGGGACGQGIACGFNFASAGNAAHEFGHTIGLNHNGPYGIHEPNCKPNYPSLMNYAYLGSGLLQFSDGHKFPALNNHSLVETGAIDPKDGGLLRMLDFSYGYKVDSATGSVDWNRDNQFAPAGTTVRAYANLLPGDGGGCEFTREGEQLTGMLSARSPAVIRFEDHMWVFSVTLDGKLAWTYTASPFVCPQLDDCPTPAFVAPGIKDVGGLDGVDAATIVVNGRRLILIVGIRPDGTLFEIWVEEVNNLFSWNGPADIAGSSPAAGEPSLAVSRDGAAVILSYKGRDNIVRYRSRSPAAFQAEQTLTLGGKPLTINPKSSPAMAFTGLPSGITTTFQDHLLAAVADSFGYVQLYTQGMLHQGWGRLGIAYGWMGPAVGRPALAWTGAPPSNVMVSAAGATAPSTPAPTRAPVRITAPVAAAPPTSVAPPTAVAPPVTVAPPVAVAPPVDAAPLTAPPITFGRLYVLYIKDAPPAGDATNPTPVRMEMSYVDEQGKLRIGLDSFFDNVWSFAFGIDLLQPGEVGLRGAVSYSIPNAGAHPNSLDQVAFRPHADGISDLPYINYDDWKVIGWGSCQILHNLNIAAMQVGCADKSW